jgi:hypothetical protein
LPGPPAVDTVTVYNPRNSITRGSDAVIALIRNGIIDYSTFRREIEAILFHGSTVIVMGGETLTPVNKSPFAGQTLHRRFTHFWMLRDGEWRLTARHANVVVPPPAQPTAPPAPARPGT